MASRSPLSISSLRTLRSIRTFPTIPSRFPYSRPSPILHRLPARSASQWGPVGPRRPPPRYNRFGRAEKVYNLWYQSPGFRYGLGAVSVGGGVFYVSNLETVPITGRRRFNCISPELEKQISAGGYESVLQQYKGRILPSNHPYSILVDRVMRRLIPVSGLEREKWEVRVIDDPGQKNAFVMPG